MTALNPALTPFLEEIRASARPSVVFTLTAEPCTITDSKVGGMPYWPEEMPYPSNPEGQPLRLLAQLNFAEMPALPDFPSSGILQFFIDSTNDLIGLNFDDMTDQRRFRVVYHSEIRGSGLLQAPPPLELEEDYGPFEGERREYRMHFAPAAPQWPTLEDYRFNQLAPRLAALLDGRAEADDYGWELHENYSEANGSGEHRIGGYPYFTQCDPRGEEKYSGYELLFQLNSDWGNIEDVEICWGDAGVGNFFIRPDDLRQRDFSQVMFSWDCC